MTNHCCRQQKPALRTSLNIQTYTHNQFCLPCLFSVTQAGPGDLKTELLEELKHIYTGVPPNQQCTAVKGTQMSATNSTRQTHPINWLLTLLLLYANFVNNNIQTKRQQRRGTKQQTVINTATVTATTFTFTLPVGFSTASSARGVLQIQDLSRKCVLRSQWTGPNQTTDLRNRSRRGRPFLWKLAVAQRHQSPILWLWRPVLDLQCAPGLPQANLWDLLSPVHPVGQPTVSKHWSDSSNRRQSGE